MSVINNLLFFLCGLEIFWNAVNKVENSKEDDQRLVNIALSNLSVNWTKSDHSCANNELHCTHKGHTEGGLNVTLLSQDIICRNCDMDKAGDYYYVWHDRAKRNGENKEKNAREGHVWLLKRKWRIVFDQSKNYGTSLIDKITKKTSYI